MAKIKLGTLVSDIRGAVGGTVFSRNKGGAYARKNTAPTNANTTAQTQARGIFGQVSQAWRDLTGGQQNAWNVAAPNFPYTDVFGDAREYSGRTLFMKLNSQLLLVDNSASILTVPPTPAVLEAIFGAQLAVTTTTMTLTINGGNNLPAGQEILVFASAPVSPGVRAVSSAGNYRQIGAFTGTLGVADIFTAYSAVYGAPVSGMRIFVKTKTLEAATGVTLVGQNTGGVVA